MDKLVLATKLERILSNYLKCEFNDFGIKANDNLLKYDWKSPVYFALGYKYGKSNNAPKVKEIIDNFREIFIGDNLIDAIEEFKSNNLNSTDEEAYQKIENIINELQKILK